MAQGLCEREPSGLSLGMAARHLAEWEGLRAFLTEAVDARDPLLVRTARTAAEALRLCQEGERRALGAGEGADGGEVRISWGA